MGYWWWKSTLVAPLCTCTC